MIAELEKLLHRTIGLDAAAIGQPAIEHAVQRCLQTSGAAGETEFFQRVTTSAADLQSLVEAVVVPETWFFRDRAAFDALARFVREEWLARQSAAPLRLLSAACATGEEAYSLAMTLLDEKLPPERFIVDAVDISATALTKARVAGYGKNSFRGDDEAFRDRYFHKVAHGHQLNQEVRGRVQFAQVNLLDAATLGARAPYDIIFCRNVFIYFDRATQERVAHTLHELLADDGLLFVGPSESGLLLNFPLEYSRWPRSFAFRKVGPNTPLPPPRRRRAELERSAS